MTTEEADKFMRLLNRKWPNRFDPDDLLTFATKLDGFEFELLEGIAAELKVTFSRAPTLKDFFDSIRDRENKEASEPVERTVPLFDLVQHIQQQSPALRGMNAAATILLYHRHTHRRMIGSYKNRPDSERAPESVRLQNACHMALLAAGYVWDEALNASKWIAADYSNWVDYIAQVKTFDLLKEPVAEEVAA